MDLSKWLNDERLLANLIGIHIVLAVLLILSVVLRRTLKSVSEQLGAPGPACNGLTPSARRPERECERCCSGPPSRS